MSTANRVIKNTGFLYAKMGITVFISLYTTRLVLSALGASDFGVFNVVGGAIAMLGFLNAAMAGATQRFMSFHEGKGEKSKQKQIFNVSLVLHFFIAMALGVILLLVGFFFFNGILNISPDRIYAAKVVYGSLIISTMFTVMSVPYEAVLNARENMLYYSIVGVLESLLKLAVALIVVYYTGDKLKAYGIFMACIPLLILTIMRIYCHKKYEECVIAKKYWDSSLMKEMSSFAGWNLLGSSTVFLSNYGMGILMNNFFGTLVNASQGIVNQISGQLGVLGTSIKKSLNPVIAKSVGANDYELMIRSTILGTKIIFYVVAVCFLPFLVEMSFILRVWLENPPPYVMIFCWLLLLANLIDQLVLFLPQAISAYGDIKKFQKSLSYLSLLPLIIGYVLFANGAPVHYIYIVLMVVSIVKVFSTIYFAQKLCNISAKKYLKDVVLRLVASFGLSLLTVLYFVDVLDEGWLRLGINTMFSVIIYSALFYFIGLNKDENSFIINKLKGIYHKSNFFKKTNC